MSDMEFFRVSVARIADLTPSFRRFTFTGEQLHRYGDPGFDQRIKVVFPSATASIDDMPTGEDWYTTWRELPVDRRPPFRTYTTRAVRGDLREVDVDMVAHDVSGPASAWIQSAQVGDELLILAPTVEREGVSLGVDFVPPAEVEHVLLAGDETAAPAIAVILEQLPRTARGTVVLEVPDDRDAAYLPDHPGFAVHVTGRGSRQRNEHLVQTVRDVAPALCAPGRGSEVEEIDVDSEILWDVPTRRKGATALRSAPLYAWLAGESAGIKTLRRHLVSEHGVDRRAVAFMGYWRLGRSEI